MNKWTDAGIPPSGSTQQEWHADMHARNAAAGIEGAARHRAAIATLNETGAVTLNDAVGVAA